MPRLRPLAALCAAGLVAAGVTTLGDATVARAADSNAVSITEFMASNQSTAVSCGAAVDWVEVRNSSSATVDIAGMHLTDTAANPTKWTFPPGSTIAANGYRVFCPDDGTPGGFGLSKSGEYLALTTSAGAIVGPTFTFPAQCDDVSYGQGSTGGIGFMSPATPNSGNGAARATCRLATPTLSRPGGFVAPGTTTAVTMFGPAGATLRWTTDGTTPTPATPTTCAQPTSGCVVQVPNDTRLRVIAIQTGNPPSLEATATFLSTAGVLAQGTATPAGWPASGAVNGQKFVYGLDQGQVAANRGAVEAALTSVPTLSIVTDQRNLTDPATGIYVNAVQSGSSWERGASVEYIDPTGQTGNFQINAGLRIKGGFSRQPQFPNHGFSLRFGDNYDGDLTTPTALFGDGVRTFESLDLRTEHNLSWPNGSANSTFLREIWSRDAQLAAGQPALHSRWVQLYLNGQFWGLYVIIERMSSTQAAAMLGGNPAEYNVLKPADDLSYEAEDGVDDDWRRLWALTADQVVTDAEYAEISQSVDLPSLATFQIINEYTGNLDASPSFYDSNARANNWMAVGGPGHPYRFFVTDAEWSLGTDVHDVNVNRTGPFPVLGANPFYQERNFNPAWLASALESQPAYRQLSGDIARWLLSPGGALDAGANLARWNTRKAQVQPVVWSEAARWGHDVPGGPYGYGHWTAETNWVESVWFPQRTPIALRQILVSLMHVDGTNVSGGNAVALRFGDAHPVA